eukprot:99332-Chlamydomonas_euryale.AAC.1
MPHKDSPAGNRNAASRSNRADAACRDAGALKAGCPFMNANEWKNVMRLSLTPASEVLLAGPVPSTS